MVNVTEETPYLSGLLATVTVMTLMTMIYGLILDEGMRLYFVGPYHFNLTRRTRRWQQMVPHATQHICRASLGTPFTSSSGADTRLTASRPRPSVL
jgi:hypothetical protein